MLLGGFKNIRLKTIISFSQFRRFVNVHFVFSLNWIFCVQNPSCNYFQTLLIPGLSALLCWFAKEEFTMHAMMSYDLVMSKVL